MSDQFGSLTAFLAASGLHPRHTLAVGTSMGGLINSLIDQEPYGRVQGAVTFCGLVAGGVDLNNYQLNAEYAMTELLPGAAGVQIRDFASMAAGSAAGTELSTAVASAQSSGGRPGPHRAQRGAAQRDRLDHRGGPARRGRLRGPGAAGGGDAHQRPAAVHRVRPVHASRWPRAATAATTSASTTAP